MIGFIVWRQRQFARIRPFFRDLALTNWLRFLPKFLQAGLIHACPVFDTAWFSAKTGLSGNRFKFALRFTNSGMPGDTANPMFDGDWYRARYGIDASASEALLHYWILGDRLGMRPHPWFDAGFFRRHYRRSPWSGTALILFLRQWQSYPLGHPLFDPDWYLQSYPDVRDSGQNPLLHFILYGQKENRRPNGYFVPDWYVEKNPDLGNSGIIPALHYCLYGAAEGRSPGPDFDSAAYFSQYPEMASSQMDALAHFLTTGRYTGAVAGARCLKVSDLAPRLCGLPTSGHGHIIDVVIPVYRGLEETRACIESVLRSSSYQGIRLRLYNDASPEPEVTEYLRRVKLHNPETVLIENSVNKGFVRTVNSAMRAAHESKDFHAVILLNSDAEVANDWVERLLSHACPEAGKVATVTALSNNATICSYPKIGENELPPECNTSDLDKLVARTNRGESVQVPTGVGFCMLITRNVLQSLGFFDEEAFGRGYGEEVDFCMRANASGFRNLLALDVFVRHIGEVSFADVSKPGKVIAQKILQERYPSYNKEVAAFVSVDPGLAARVRITLARWKASGRQVHVLFTHALGGGTERRVREATESLVDDTSVVIIRPVKHPGRISIEYPAVFDGFQIDVEVNTGMDMSELLALLSTHSIQIHHVLGFGNFVREGIALYGKGYDFVVHDYYTICPQVTLTDARARYCGEPDARGCDACIAKRPSYGAADIRNWRMSNEWLVLGADQVIAPSHDAAARIERYTGRRPSVEYHEQLKIVPPDYACNLRGPFRVVVIGVLAPHKGREVVLAAASAAQRLDLPLAIHLIGDPQGNVPREARGRLTHTGFYREEDLSRLIEEANPDAFLFAAPWPETYSYTLSAALNTGRPVIATDIGAFTERLAGYHSSCLVPWDIDGEELALRISSYLQSLQKSRSNENLDSGTTLAAKAGK